MANPVWNEAWQAYDDGQGHMWRSDSEGWIAAPTSSAPQQAAAPAPQVAQPRPVVGGFAQEVPSTAGQRIPNGGRAGVTGGTPSPAAPTAPAAAGGGTPAGIPRTQSTMQPGQAAGNREDWLATRTMSMITAYFNGTSMTYPEMADSWSGWRENGGSIERPPREWFGILNPASPNYNPHFQAAPGYLEEIMGAVARVQIQNDPVGRSLPSNPIVDTGTQDAARQAADRAAAGANALAVQNAQNAGSLATQNAADIAAGNRNKDTIAQSDKEAQLRATVDREGFKSTEGIASADRTSRETIAEKDRTEKAREFDISTKEGARQFNATALMTLMDKGIALAQHPVDWLGYQFYLNKMGVVMNALNTNAAVNLLGAVPPTGPSAAGPVIGGAGVMHGDMEMAQAAGVQPQFVTVSQAVQANPGNGAEHGIGDLTASAQIQGWAAQVGGIDQLDHAVAQARVAEVAPAMQASGADPSFIQSTIQSFQTAAAAAPAPSLGNGGFGTSATPAGGVAPPPPPPAATPAVGVPEPFKMGAGSYPWQSPPIINQGGPDSAAPPPAAPMAAPSLGNTAAVMPQPTYFAPATPLTAPSLAPAPQPTVSTGGNTGGGNSGIYTGPQTTTPVAPAPTGGMVPAPSLGSPGTGAQNPQGSDMIQAIANQLGMPFEQVSQMIDPKLIAGGYSLQQVMDNSPIIKSIRENGNSGLARINTGDQGKFGTIQATGTQVGRGGIDYNAQTFLNVDGPTQDMIAGTWNAMGRDAATEQKNMLRNAPLSDYNVGSFGRRM